MPRPTSKAAPKAEAKKAVAAEEAVVVQEGALVPAEQALVAVSEEQEKTADSMLAEYKLWAGWKESTRKIPLGPGLDLELPAEDMPNPDVVGHAYPLGPVEYAYRNERKFPPPTETDMYGEMLKLCHHTLTNGIFKESAVLEIIYGHINRNARDSVGWQRGFIKAKGVKKLVPYCSSEKEMERYWAISIFGRMMGTSDESRAALIKAKVHEHILRSTKDSEEDVKAVAVSALKGLIQHPDGRAVVTYEKLIECLAASQD